MKKILSKLPLFLFCVLFLTGYNQIFGEQNATIGVVLLMGLLMFLSSDLGFSNSAASISIPIIYLIMVFGAHFSLINPYLGLVINFVSLAVLMLLCGNNPEKSNFLVGMMGYIFCIGNDVGGELLNKRALSVIIISFLMGIIYFILHRKKGNTDSLFKIAKNFDIRKKEDSWKLRLIVSLTLVMFACQLFSYLKTMWVCFPLLSLIHLDEQEYNKRKFSRLPATVIGSIAFYLFYILLIPEKFHQPLILILGFGAMFITSYFIKTIYNSFSALTTAILFIGSKEAVILRIVSNLIGIVIAVIIEETRQFLRRRQKPDLLSD